ncbi:MAG: Mrp/NBP35 family ATP-binding protein [Pseudomonadota bacterium]
MFWSKKERSVLDEAAVRRALGDPDWLSGVRITDGRRVTVVLQADPNDLERSEAQRLETEARLRSLPGIEDVNAVLTAERPAGLATHSSTARPPVSSPRPGTQRVEKGARLSDAALDQGQAERPVGLEPIAGISRILVVASAKGGVGKSTVSVNLAAAFARQGLRVGLLDADIYGPSIPTMLGVADADPKTSPDGKLVPVRAHGIETLSIGYLTDTDAPMIWRGPIVQSAITQMLNDAAWGSADNPLDLLIIDTPPGTGEAQLTLAQRVPVDAALLVTTPQEVALADVRRGAAMFAKTHVPVLGLVETMSWFDDPSGVRHYLMGEGGGGAMARALGLPLLAQLPMLTEIREGGDLGTPATLGDGPANALFHGLARTVALALDAVQTKAPPNIIFE